MAERHKTDYQIRQIPKYNSDGSPERQEARHENLIRCVKQLQSLGYSKRWDVHKLGKTQVSRLVNLWRDAGNEGSTIANKMIDLRWLASKVNRSDQMPSNKDIGVPLRSSHKDYNTDKSQELTKVHLDTMDLRMQLVNQLKYEFGLREKEACKFQYRYATQGAATHIRLMGSWCKNGRPRKIEIVNDRQRDLLKRVQGFQQDHKEKSMTPKGQKVRTYKNKVQAHSTKLGIKGHGFRHHWAQTKFTEVSGGIKPRLAGGPAYSSLSKAERARWDKAARRVNEELGHGKGRKDITATYIGVGE
jgi:hypothetical protein